MANIVFLDSNSVASHIKLPAIVDQSGHTQTVREYSSTNPAQTLERIKDADVVISNKVILNHEILKQCRTLKHIAVAATGYNNVDIQACKALNINVSRIPSYASVTVPEHVVSVMLALRRQLLSYRSAVIAGDWQNSETFCLFAEPIKDLKNSTLGIIGFGELGQATAQLAHALGMQVVYTSRRDKHSRIARYLELDELLKTSHVVSLHCDLNESTRGLIGKRELALMPRDAILINTARGGIVDENAAVEAIKNKTIAGLGFDVLSVEPPESSNALLSIADRANVIITPHVAWASDAAMQSLMQTLAKNIESHLRGEALNLVT